MTDSSELLASLFPGDDEAASLARATDWAATPLGPPESWGPELCAAIRTVLPSKVPMLLWWGEDLVQVYNDAYRPFLGSKHPGAMGQPGAECWPEIWAEVGPMARKVVESGVANYEQSLLLFLERHGFTEETYWTFSYSPVWSADGAVLGVFVATSDVTAPRIESRRLQTVRELAVLSSAEPAATLAGKVTAALEGNRYTVPFAAVYLPDADRGALVRTADYGLGPANSTLPASIALDGHHPVAKVATSRSGGFHIWDPDELNAEPGPLGPTRPTGGHILPLGDPTRSLEGVVVLGLNPYRPIDDAYLTFVTLLGRQVSALLAEARMGEVERARTTALTALDASKTAFFANVSHEFGTPLTVAFAAVRELRESGLSDEQAQHVDAIARASTRLNRLVEALLDFARAEAGQLVPEPEPVDLAELTTDVLGMFRSAIESAGLALHAEVDDVGLVVTDRETWVKVVGNLVSNAYKFTESGAIRVSLRRIDETVELAVADTGRGIAPEQVDKVFARFHQVVQQPARGVAGTGIGLALVRDLVETQAGRVSLESRLGEGTTVTVTMPVVRHAEGALPPRRAELATGAEGLLPDADVVALPAGSVAAEDAPRLLLVEDHADVRAYLSRLLAADGWSVVAVADAAAAMRTTEAPDIVLCDVMLPGPSGLDLVRMLRADRAWAHVPVVLLTARTGTAEVAEGLAAGADDYVRKPFEPVELAARLRSHLELARGRSEVAVQDAQRAANLESALESNRVIGMAIGVLMSSHRVTSARAFELLRVRSNQTNRKLREVAEEVVLSGELSTP
ncbi:Signal transduction histidine kinase [Pedococcus dokdonensis]|uniref:histidine kinase n=1 Tax=Pedococcus dokdonensis TaxID=443156 RepID=A0A1H0UBA0_9MICO|nr:ATP-binding protein [Pedococcus dokdonensis]SDP63401.1 Signal transduction histidine kinase [Pedococcus dokdonensis]